MKFLVWVLLFSFLSVEALATKGGFEEVKKDRDETKITYDEQRAGMIKTVKAIDKTKKQKEKYKNWYKKLSRSRKALHAGAYAARMSWYNGKIGTLTTKLGVQAAAHKPVKDKYNKLVAECKTLECDSRKYDVYIIAVSGGGGGYIEDSLNLRDMVDSSRIFYREANWNNLYNSEPEVEASSPVVEEVDRFQKQIKTEFKKMPARSKLILIGHSLGGGAVLKASDVAGKIDRKIDLLIALDPVGEFGLRVNVVKRRPITGPCVPPRFTDSEGNTRGSDAAYKSCKAAAMKFVVGKNVKYFVNRWQTQEMWPIDYSLGGFIDTHKDVGYDQDNERLSHGEVLDQNVDMVRDMVGAY